jgi:hypothetical protein
VPAILIREAVDRIAASAARLGLSRDEYLRHTLEETNRSLAHKPSAPKTGDGPHSPSPTLPTSWWQAPSGSAGITPHQFRIQLS